MCASPPSHQTMTGSCQRPAPAPRLLPLSRWTWTPAPAAGSSSPMPTPASMGCLLPEPSGLRRVRTIFHIDCRCVFIWCQISWHTIITLRTFSDSWISCIQHVPHVIHWSNCCCITLCLSFHSNKQCVIVIVCYRTVEFWQHFCQLWQQGAEAAG